MKLEFNKRTYLSRLRTGLVTCVFGLLTFNSALAAPIQIADFPPFLGGTVAPNIMFIIDDSGSMQFEVPDGLPDKGTNYLFPPVSSMYGGGIYTSRIFTFDYNNQYNRYFRSNATNLFFYDPTKTYEPWFKGDRSQWEPADPEAAYYFPGRTDSGTLDLTSEHSHYYWKNNDGYSRNDSKNYWPITYYTLKSPGADPWDKENYIQYQVRNSIGYIMDLETGIEKTATEFKHDGVTRTVEEEIKNFANWFSYYRSRTLASRSGIGNAFSKQGEGMRVGYGSLNKSSGKVDGESTSVIVDGVRLFTGTDREGFFNRLYTDTVPSKGTPLRNALYHAGKYFERDDEKGPWAAEPGKSNDATDLQCRQSFTILMTDGYWSKSHSTVKNADNSSGPEIDGKIRYEPKAPFKDSYDNTLADIAMHFWKRDLRPTLANEVPVSQKAGNIDPAFWQHMVTFGVGLGVTGSIDPKTAFDAILTGDSIDWPNPHKSESAKVDDLLHAGVNGRGGFFNAADPDTFASKLTAVLKDIVSRVEESSTSAAASSAILRQDALSFSAGFRSTDWSGALQATEILPGGARGRLIWDAEYGLAAKGADDRNLYTSSGGSGVELDTIGDLSSEQQAALNTASDGTSDGLGQDRINWLRGKNDANPLFRDRLYVPSASGAADRLRLLGDVIGSDPQFAGKSNFGHRRLSGAEGSSYATYRSSTGYLERRDVIYVGANDGYLHGFDSLTGEELFAYMPSELVEPASGSDFARINTLIEPDFDHRYFVDGTPTIGDVYINGQWKTVLIGTMGAGGKTVFALDVSDPSNFSADDVLWEFTHSELGYGAESPRITKLESGEWVAVFGNGFNSTSNESALFIVDIKDGSLVGLMETGEGDSGSPNGMATPEVLIDQQNGTGKSAYVGDLQGNLWRADLTAGNLNSGSAISKLFAAKSSDGSRQPITAAPALAQNPDGRPGDLVIVFGTGSYFRVTDSGDNQVQTLYGIFDDGSSGSIGRGELLQQTITDQSSTAFEVDNDGTLVSKPVDTRVVSAKELDGEPGWYMDLDQVAGERVISSPSFPSGFSIERVRFSTLIPDNNDCGGGRDGYLMDIDIATGGQTKEPVFDLNRDGKYNDDDNAPDSGSGSSIISGVRGVVAGETVSVINDDKSDLFIGSVIIDLPSDYSGPIDLSPPDPDPDEGSGPGDGSDPDEDPEQPESGNCEGPLCSAADGFNFGRQSWEELR